MERNTPGLKGNHLVGSFLPDNKIWLYFYAILDCSMFICAFNSIIVVRTYLSSGIRVCKEIDWPNPKGTRNRVRAHIEKSVPDYGWQRILNRSFPQVLISNHEDTFLFAEIIESNTVCEQEELLQSLQKMAGIYHNDNITWLDIGIAVSCIAIASLLLNFMSTGEHISPFSEEISVSRLERCKTIDV